MLIKLYNKANKIYKIISNKYYLSALQKGVAAAVEHEKHLKNISCKTVVDIGANRGQFALVARHCFREANIYSFEPLVAPATKFRSVFSNDSKVQLYQNAIGPENETAEIHISMRDDSSSLLPITKRQNDLFPGTAERCTEMIHVVPLRDNLSKSDVVSPALLKLDVQGFEYEVLLGCENFLNSFSFVYVECSFIELYEGQVFADKIIAFLRERNFVLNGVYNLCYDKRGKAVQADFFFVARGSNV